MAKTLKKKVKRNQPRVFYAMVFNAEQIDGLEPLKKPELTFDPVEKAEGLLASTGIKIIHDQDNRAFYKVKADEIHLPPQEAFNDAYGYYATALHEVAHATMHESRLNRPDAHNFHGTTEYAKEELRAEITSAILAGELGIGNQIEEHASYVEGWLKVLKEDRNEIFRAARDADQIAAWITGTPEKRLELQNQAAKAAESREAKEVDMNFDEHYYINVSYDGRNEAKAVGAKWDRNAKSWYVSKNSDLNLVAKWDKPAPTPENGVSPIQEFGNFIRKQGLKLDGDPVMDGQWHRVQLEGQDEQKNKRGAYKGYLDGKPNGLVQNFRNDDTAPMKWVTTGFEITADERAALKEQWENRKRHHKAELNEKGKDNIKASDKINKGKGTGVEL
jgi:hypothetical protein